MLAFHVFAFGYLPVLSHGVFPRLFPHSIGLVVAYVVITGLRVGNVIPLE